MLIAIDETSLFYEPILQMNDPSIIIHLGSNFLSVHQFIDSYVLSSPY